MIDHYTTQYIGDYLNPLGETLSTTGQPWGSYGDNPINQQQHIFGIIVIRYGNYC